MGISWDLGARIGGGSGQCKTAGVRPVLRGKNPPRHPPPSPAKTHKQMPVPAPFGAHPVLQSPQV